MRRFILIGTFAVLLFPLPAARGANGKLDEVLSRMQEASKKLVSIRATMEQVKQHTQIGGQENYTGDMIFKHLGRGKDKVRINYRKTNQVVAVDGDKIMLYQPKINQVFITCRSALASQHPDYAFITALYASVDELKERYAIAYLRDEQFEQINTSVLEMTPKSKSAEVKTTLWVSRVTWMPIRFQVIERNKDVTTLTLRDIARNSLIKDDEFRLTWPSRTNVSKESCH